MIYILTDYMHSMHILQTCMIKHKLIQPQNIQLIFH